MVNTDVIHPGRDSNMNSPKSQGIDTVMDREYLLFEDRSASTQPLDPQDDGRRNRIPRLLHVGCGAYAREKLPLVFRTGWDEIRLDIDPGVQPDIVANLTDISVVPDNAIDAIYSSHNLEHLWPHEVPLALREMTRVLTPTGFALIKLPDLREVARYVADGVLTEPLYLSPMGPITALDIIYGHRPSLELGNAYMAHRTGFTAETLASALIASGFTAVLAQSNPPVFSLTAIAFRTKPGQDELTAAQARLLPAMDRPAVLYAAPG
jgi:SAM-dependent methyltransferase